MDGLLGSGSARPSAALFFLLFLACHDFGLNSEEEDWDSRNRHHAKTTHEARIRYTETVFGIPLPLDQLFEQITSLPADDPAHDSNECTSGTDLSELDMCLSQAQIRQFETLSDLVVVKRRTSGKSRGTSGVHQYQGKCEGPDEIVSLWHSLAETPRVNCVVSLAATDRDAIINAMSEWEKRTCIRFRPANMEDRDVVVFRDGKRCSTNIGRIGREQAVTLAKSCRSKRILIHELGHVIGLIHEHQRFDRDKYVKVLMENVRNMSQERYQFSRLLSGSITDKTVKYDYTSVMHYGKNYFARSPELTTLQTKDHHFQDVIGRAEKPSFSDLETVNRLYQCAAGCPGSLRCGPSCYMDMACVCRCRAGSDKAFFHGPGPYGNSLPDQTCEFFATRGECLGNIKDTIRPLCAKSCGLYQSKGGGNNRAELGSSWSPSNRPNPKPLGSPSFKTNVNVPSIKEMPMFQGFDPRMEPRMETRMEPRVAFSQTRANRMRPAASFQRPDPQFRPVGDSMAPPNRIRNPARNQLDAPSPMVTFRSGLLQRPTSLGSSDSSIFGPLLMTRTSNGRMARLYIPTQVRGRAGLQGRMSNRQRINFLARKASVVPGYLSNNPELEALLNNGQNGVNSLSSNSLQSLPRQAYQRGFSRQPVRQVSNNNYDLNALGASSISGRGSSNWGFNGLDRSMNLLKNQQATEVSSGNQLSRPRGNYAGIDVWPKSRASGTRVQGQPRSVDRGVMGSLSRGGPEFGQVDPLSVNVNPEPLPDAQVRKYGSQNLQTTGPSFMKSGQIYADNSLKGATPARGMAGINQLETPKGQWEFQHQPHMPTADQQRTAQSTPVDLSPTPSGSGTRKTIAVSRTPLQQRTAQSTSGDLSSSSGGSRTRKMAISRIPLQQRTAQSSSVDLSPTSGVSGNRNMLAMSRMPLQTMKSQKRPQFTNEAPLGELPPTRGQISFSQQQSIYSRDAAGVEKVRFNSRPGVAVDQTAFTDPQPGQMFNQLLDTLNPAAPSQRRWNSPTLFSRINRMQAMSDPVASSFLDSANNANEKQRLSIPSQPFALGLTHTTNKANENVLTNSSITTSTSRGSLTQQQATSLHSFFSRPDSRSNFNISRVQNSHSSRPGVNRNELNLTNEFFRDAARSTSTFFYPAFLGSAGRYLAPTSTNLFPTNRFNSFLTTYENRSDTWAPIAPSGTRQNVGESPRSDYEGPNADQRHAGTSAGQRIERIKTPVRTDHDRTQVREVAGPEVAAPAVAHPRGFTQRLPDETREGPSFF